jgi:dipeptidyl aminopeptidase/acylaminoacyl peptidase
MRRGALGAIAALAWLAATGAVAQGGREPVLEQVAAPHNYYWRELYLPQLTMGPSSASFMPSGDELVYSMGGSLWRQRIDSPAATELTHATGAYDYQPDVASDGRRVVFTRYDGKALELWELDLTNGRERALTQNGAVNVEPRVSPDGRRLAWVSTQREGMFAIFVAELGQAGLANAEPLLPLRRSTTDRYYYGAIDHSINPAWSPDGQSLYYVGNPEVVWGSGDIYRVALAERGAPRKVLSEVTTWSARPEPSPDGHRILYSSYHGRQWHQLWLTTPSGAAPLPLTFGEFDRRDARWSPDGRQIAYISNQHGATELVVQQVIGGATAVVRATERLYRSERGAFEIQSRAADGSALPVRVSVVASDQRAYAPDDGWMHADDSFDRSVQRMETHYFHCAGTCSVSLPSGAARVTVRRGFRYTPLELTVRVDAGRPARLAPSLELNALPEGFGQWLSADLHVHMNYGGQYRNKPEHL